VKSEDVDVSRTIVVNGVPFEQLVERNGQPPSADEERKQNEKLDKLKRETPEQRPSGYISRRRRMRQRLRRPGSFSMSRTLARCTISS